MGVPVDRVPCVWVPCILGFEVLAERSGVVDESDSGGDRPCLGRDLETREAPLVGKW